MKILLITEFFSSLKNPQFSGGVETRTFYTAKYLSFNNQVTIFSRRKIGEEQVEKFNNLVIYRFGSEIKSSVANLTSIISRLAFVYQCLNKSKTINCDLVEGSNFVSYLPTILISKFKNIPKIAWYPDTLKNQWIKQFGLILGLIGEISEFIYLKIKWNKIITISENVKNKLIRSNIRPELIRVVYCGTEPLTIKPKIKVENNQLLVISRLVKYKRVDWAIDLINELKYEFPKLNLIIVGRGPEENNLKKLANKYNLNSQISFNKNLPYNILNKIISQSKILIHPSLIEGFGIVFLECSKYGIPFIASDIPTSIEINQKLNSGILFKKNNFKDLINQTIKSLTDKNLYKDLSNNGIKNTKRFNWELLSKQTEKIYQKVISN